MAVMNAVFDAVLMRVLNVSQRDTTATARGDECTWFSVHERCDSRGCCCSCSFFVEFKLKFMFIFHYRMRS